MPPARSPRSKKQMHNKKQMRAVPGHHLWPGYATVHVHYHITFHRHSRIIHPLSTGKQVKCTSSKMLHSFHLTQPTKCFTTNNVPNMASPHLPLQYTWKHRTLHMASIMLYTCWIRLYVLKQINRQKQTPASFPGFSSTSISTIHAVCT